MQKLAFCFLFLVVSLSLFAQTTEHYLQIKIDSREDLEYLTRIVSIDNVIGLDVIAYANDEEFEKLKTSKFQFIELEHPSMQASRAITMATTVGDMANWDRYPTYSVYNQRMVKFVTDYPALCRLDTVGTSVQNRNILVLNITSEIAVDKAKPEVLLSSTIHGDETTGWILCMRLADYLLSNYGTDTRITAMLDSVSIFIAPNTNPDGTYHGSDNNISGATRYNANYKDLNRNFPDPRVGDYPDGPRQKETTIMMDYADTRRFSLAINYHGGAEVANYPWDCWTSAQKKHPDDAWYKLICREYATLAQTSGAPSNYFRYLQNGITNGGDWYVISGGRQDYMNYWHHCKEITLEVSNTKMVSTEQLPSFWNYNREAMLTFIENVYYGIRGKVTDNAGNPLATTITIVGYDQYNSFVKTNPDFGDYYRMLAPSTYTLKFEADGYVTQTIPNVVVVGENTTTYLNVVMQSVNANSTYTITASVNGNGGTINPSGNVTVTEGDNQSFSITPNTGYRISQVLIDGENDTDAVNSGSYTFTNVASSHTIAASFIDNTNPELIGLTVNGNSISVDDDMEHMAVCGDTEVVLNLTANATIKVNGNPYVADMSIPFINDKAVINIVIEGATAKTYTLTVSKALGSPAMQMYVERWKKTLAVINNPNNNGEHTFNKYRWYCNDEEMIGEVEGYILLNGRPAIEYSAQVHSMKTDVWHKLCPYVLRPEQTEIAVYPNPVGASQLLNINLPQEVNSVNVNIYDISGNLVRQQKGVHNAVTMPHQTGMYIIEIQLPDGTKNIQQVIIK